MNDLVLIGGGLAILVVVLAVVFGGAARYPYERAGPLLSANESAFLAALHAAVGGTFSVFLKVRIADVLSVKKGLDKRKQTIALNKIAAKHVDFVLCDPKTFEVRMAIEVDDSSHSLSGRKSRDHFVDKAFHAAGVHLVRVKARGRYDAGEVRSQIEQALTGKTVPNRQ